MIGPNMKEWIKFIVVGLVSLFPISLMGQGPEEALTKTPTPEAVSYTHLTLPTKA